MWWLRSRERERLFPQTGNRKAVNIILNIQNPDKCRKVSFDNFVFHEPTMFSKESDKAIDLWCMGFSVVATVLVLLACFRAFRVFDSLNECLTIVGTTCNRGNLLGDKNLLSGQRKTFGWSCRSHGRTLVFKFSANILTLCQKDELLQVLQKDKTNIQV